MHTFAIIVHTVSGIAAFIIGLLILFQPDKKYMQRLGNAFVLCLVLLEVFLLTAIASHWQSLSGIIQFTFSLLALLGLYMIWRGIQAHRLLVSKKREDHLTVIDHTGFILISLFEGFIIVSAIDIHAPAWGTGIVAIGAVLLGSAAINRLKSQELSGKRLHIRFG